MADRAVQRSPRKVPLDPRFEPTRLSRSSRTMAARTAPVDVYRRPQRDISGRSGPLGGAPDTPRDAVAAAGPSFRELRAARDKGGSMRLLDAMRCVAPTWIEGVAVVQAVCAQLSLGETPPAIGDIVLLRSGAVSFPLGGMVDADVAIQAVGRLLAAFLRACGGPLALWDATDVARQAPMSFRTVHGFGAALTCLPTQRGAQDLAAYFRLAQALAPITARTPRRSRVVTAPTDFVW